LEKIPLSVAIITKNEEENIRACLQSISFVGQIVVVDSGSNDATLSIAAEFGCEIYSEQWRGFGLQKQSAIDKCRHPWILVLDADERIPPGAADIIRKIVTDSNVKESGFSFPRKNYFQGRWIKHAGWWPDRIVRLFRKEKGRMSTAIVHESVEDRDLIRRRQTRKPRVYQSEPQIVSDKNLRKQQFEDSIDNASVVCNHFLLLCIHLELRIPR